MDTIHQHNYSMEFAKKNSWMVEQFKNSIYLADEAKLKILK